MRVRSLIAHRSSLIASLALLVACRAAPAPTAGLEAAVRAYYAGMASSDAAENRRAMDGLAVTRDDVAALLPPARVDAVWAVWGPEREALLRDAPQHAVHFRDVLPLGAVTSTDLRAAGDVVMARSLQELPADVPVYGVQVGINGAERQRAAGAFLFVRGRWIWMWDLARLGAVVSEPPSDPPFEKGGQGGFPN